MKQIEVLYEDNHIIVVNKPSGILVQGDKTGDITLLQIVKSYIKGKYKKQGNVFLGLVHRLDRPVSGAILFAKSSKALSRLNKIIQPGNNKFIKTYWAITQNIPPKEKDTLEHYLWKNQNKNKSYAYNFFRKGSKRSLLSYELVGQSSRYYFLEIVLQSGRHHQIRCQLAKIGCPIKGDLKYGFPRSNIDGGISLHARFITFFHPVKKKFIQIVAPCRKDNLWKIFSYLRS